MMKARVLELNASDERGIQVSCYSLLITGIILTGRISRMCIISLTGIGGKFFFSAIVVISEIMLPLSRYT